MQLVGFYYRALVGSASLGSSCWAELFSSLVLRASELLCIRHADVPVNHTEEPAGFQVYSFWRSLGSSWYDHGS